MNKKRRFSVSYFISVFMIILAIQWIFFPLTNIRQIGYDTFNIKTGSEKVDKVLILLMEDADLLRKWKMQFWILPDGYKIIHPGSFSSRS